MSENKDGKIGDNTAENGYNDPNTGHFVAGNPGKPKGARHITTLVREALVKIGKTKDGKEISYEQAFVERILDKAIIEGDPAMMKIMWAYLDGMPSQNINLNNMDEVRKNYFDKLNALIESDTGDSTNNIQK